MISAVKVKPDKSWLIFIAAAVIFLALKINAADYSISDENTYYKMGQLVSEGQVPYKDFFFAHTPLQVYLYAAIIKIFWFNLLLLKMLSAIAMVITAAFVFATIKERINGKIAAAAATLFLFSYGTLLFSNFPTGAELAVPFAMAGFYFFQRKRFLLSGLMLGLGAMTYQLSALAFAVLIAFAVLRDRKAAIRLLAGFVAVVGITSLAFVIATGREFISQTAAYHLNKPAEDVDRTAIFLRVLKTNAALFTIAAVALLIKSRTKATVMIAAGTAMAYIAAFPLIKTAFNYYIIFALPFLAILAAYGLHSAYNLLTEKIKLTRAMSAIVVAVIIFTSCFIGARQFSEYHSQDFPEATEVAEYVRANSLPGQTIFGDDSTVPLISLLSGREIALNHADSNVMRYRAGQPKLEDLLDGLDEEVKNGKLRFIILRRIETDRGTYDFGIGIEKKFGDFLDEKCKPAAKAGQHRIYDCLKT